MKILVTGAAGFIGFNLIQQIIKEHPEWEIMGLDKFYAKDTFTASLMKMRLMECGIDTANTLAYEYSIESNIDTQYSLIYLDLLLHKSTLNNLFNKNKFDIVIHLAAITGVRESVTNPQLYIDNNITGFLNLLEASKGKIKHLIYASSSSVYGGNTHPPCQEEDETKPLNIYALTKKMNEEMAYVYNHLYQLPSTGLRFFTVYGPWGRPDMSYFKWTKAILEETPIDIYNYGKMSRDFTYIDDITSGIIKLIKTIDEQPTKALRPIYNMGSSTPINIMDFLSKLESILNKKAITNLLPMQQSDMENTHSNSNKFCNDFDHYFNTHIKEGLERFIKWYKSQYNQ